MPDLADSTASHRSFQVALGVVIAFAALELLATGIHFAGKSHRSGQVSSAAPSAPAASATAPPAAASPPPVAASTASSAALSASDRLLKEAQALNEKGDTANALARLQEASQRDPGNAQVLAQMATIYESIQLFDRSNETWRKIEEIGPPAGTLYELAEMKLKMGAAAGATPSPVAAPGTDSAGTPLDREGLPEGAIFGVSEISTEQVPDAEAETNFRLRIAVKKRESVAIELSKLKIIVRFYDLIDGERVADTDADVSFEWFDPKHDWSEANPELLVVSYVRPRRASINSEAALSAAAAAVTPGKPGSTSKKRPAAAAESSPSGGERRSYFGYVVRIFYDDKLQTVRADPPRLLTDAPAPATP